MMPRDHRSAVWSYGFPSTISGDMYSGEPLNEVSTMVEALMARENLQPVARHAVGFRKTIKGGFSFPLQTNSTLPKVTEFHHAALAQHYVLRFHITVQNAEGVQIVQGGQQLAGHLSHLWLAERLMCRELNGFTGLERLGSLSVYLALWQVAVILKNLKQLTLQVLGDNHDLVARSTDHDIKKKEEKNNNTTNRNNNNSEERARKRR